MFIRLVQEKQICILTKTKSEKIDKSSSLSEKYQKYFTVICICYVFGMILHEYLLIHIFLIYLKSIDCYILILVLNEKYFLRCQNMLVLLLQSQLATRNREHIHVQLVIRVMKIINHVNNIITKREKSKNVAVSSNTASGQCFKLSSLY